MVPVPSLRHKAALVAIVTLPALGIVADIVDTDDIAVTGVANVLVVVVIVVAAIVVGDCILSLLLLLLPL